VALPPHSRRRFEQALLDHSVDRRATGSIGALIEKVRFAADSPLEEAGFELVWGFSCQAVVLGCADSFLFGAGKAVFRPVACNQVPGARGRGQGTEMLAELGGLPP
jgi:hypothetical protein